MFYIRNRPAVPAVAWWLSYCYFRRTAGPPRQSSYWRRRRTKWIEWRGHFSPTRTARRESARRYVTLRRVGRLETASCSNRMRKDAGNFAKRRSLTETSRREFPLKFRDIMTAWKFYKDVSTLLSVSEFIQRAHIRRPTQSEEEEEEIYLLRTITILNKKNTILMLARSRLHARKAKSHLCWPPTLLILLH